MLLSDLDYSYPERLVATETVQPSRVMCVRAGQPSEITLADLQHLFQPGDVVVINDTQVLRRRVWTQDDLEILFLKQLNSTDWEVLCPASRVKDQARVELPQGVQMEIVARGLPQTVRLSRAVDESYFTAVGELPLPPYIQKARGERHMRPQDAVMYQTAWASKPGSFAAPTASLHFRAWENLPGVQVVPLTLHVGLGTFLPVKTELDRHVMHPEWVEIPRTTWETVQSARGRVWAVGTTVTRALESCAQGLLTTDAHGNLSGWSDLFIKEPFEFQVVTGLLTNFHQPKSTLLALVATFAGLNTVKTCYQWAIEREFRLFSYGDLTVWIH